MTNQEAANALGVSERTAKRYWSFARAWLDHEIRGDSILKLSNVKRVGLAPRGGSSRFARQQFNPPIAGSALAMELGGSSSTPRAACTNPAGDGAWPRRARYRSAAGFWQQPRERIRC